VNVQDWQIALLSVTGAASALFVIVYAVAAPWWKTQVGRALMFSEVSLGTLVTLSLMAYWFHVVISDVAALAIFAAMALSACLRLGVLVTEQVARRRES